LVAVTGAISGCGCSSVAANLAVELAQGYGARTILVEAAMQMGVQAFNLNVKPTVTLADLIGESNSVDVEQVRKALVPVTAGLHLLAAQPDLARPGPNAVKGVLTVLGLCKQLAGTVVVDVPCLYDDLYFEVLWAADRVVLIAEQSIPAVRTTRMILDAVERAKTVKAVYIVLNRYDSGIPAMSAKNIAETLGGVEVATIPNDYARVMQCASEGRSLRAADPGSPVAHAIRSLAGELLGLPMASEPKAPHLYNRVVGYLKRLGGK
jgi:pilus assembly protein CpaE